MHELLFIFILWLASIILFIADRFIFEWSSNKEDEWKMRAWNRISDTMSLILGIFVFALMFIFITCLISYLYKEGVLSL